MRIDNLLRSPAARAASRVVPRRLRRVLKSRLPAARSAQRVVAPDCDIAGPLQLVRGLTDAQMLDRAFIEHELIRALGLNNELLHEQPSELAEYYGTGLHIWQYPKQLAPLLVKLAETRPPVQHYVEIGSRWGGMFILMTEWLRRCSDGALRRATAVDMIARPPLLGRYADAASTSGVAFEFLQMSSASPEFAEYLATALPDAFLIDGDHSLEGAMKDHALAVRSASLIMHHDITSNACPHLRTMWSCLSASMQSSWEASEFVEQYPSVEGEYLGLGLMLRNG